MSDDTDNPDITANNSENSSSAASSTPRLLNEHDLRALQSTYNRIKDSDPDCEIKRKTLFLIVYCNPNLGKFSLETTAGLLNFPKNIAKKWEKQGLGAELTRIQSVRLMRPQEIQNWRQVEEFRNALEELEITPRTSPKTEVTVPEAEPPTKTHAERVRPSGAPKVPSAAHAKERPTPGALKLLPDISQHPTVSRSQLKETMIATLDDLLTPDSTGQIRFGAKNEPLRKSQIEALQAVRSHIAAGEQIFHIVQPGGSGKTREGIALAHAMHKQGRKSIYVVPTQQALKDFAEKAHALCPDLRVGKIYEGEQTIGNLTFVTYASLMRRVLGKKANTDIEKLAEIDHETALKQHAEALPQSRTKLRPDDYDMVIWDEAHMYLTANAQNLINQFKHAINIALTATPRYYEGKEVSMVFGNKAYELSLDLAKHRKEICDWENFLITTNVRTGIELTSPDQEESNKVSRAINTPSRNSIFADLYENTSFTINRKGKPKRTISLAGEPTIVLGASIDHVHDLADQINARLMPLLKTDETFRQKLRDKGIDPDKVERIAAPIYSNASKTRSERKGMSVDEQRNLIDRYHDRKVLMLVSTRVLQQSFDSPMTSVVMDTVNRQTYVGVGQGGMRATRINPDDPDKIAILINCEDADHKSLTFTDFNNSRGSEEGVAVETSRKTMEDLKEKPFKTLPSDDPVKAAMPAPYTVTYAKKLIELSKKRLERSGSIYNESGSSLFFTAEGHFKVNSLMIKSAFGDQDAAQEFLEIASPYFNRLANKMVRSIFEDNKPDKQDVKDAITFAFVDTLNQVKSGSIGLWSRFAIHFSNALRKHLNQLKHTNSSEEATSISALKKADLITQPEDTITYEELKNGVNELLGRLPYGSRNTIEMYFFEGMSPDKIANHYGISVPAVRARLAYAYRKFNETYDPYLPDAIAEWKSGASRLDTDGGIRRDRIKAAVWAERVNRGLVEPEVTDEKTIAAQEEETRQLAGNIFRLKREIRDLFNQYCSHDIAHASGVNMNALGALLDTDSLHADELCDALSDSEVRKKIINTIVSGCEWGKARLTDELSAKMEFLLKNLIIWNTPSSDTHIHR